MKKRPVTPEPAAEEEADEEALLREALKGVAPLRNRGKASLQRPLPAPIPVQSLREDVVLAKESAERP